MPAWVVVLVLVLCISRIGEARVKESNAGDATELGGYVDACNETDVPGCGTFWFYHIPKTGGTSVDKQLVKVHKTGRQEKQNFRYKRGDVWYCARTTHGTLVKQGKSYHGKPKSHSAIIKRIRNANYGRPPGDDRNGEVGNIFTVHQHHGYSSLYAISGTLDVLRTESEAAGCPFVVATVLREPISHAISTFFFTSRDITNWEFELNNNTIFDNYQSRYILNNHRDVDPAYTANGGLKAQGSLDMAAMCTASSVLTSSVDEIGFTSDLEGFMQRLSARMGFPAWKAGVRNKARPHADPPQEMMDHLREKLEMDAMLYQFALQQNGTQGHKGTRGYRPPHPECI